MIRPNNHIELSNYLSWVTGELLSIIEDITGVEVVFADPFLADVRCYIDKGTIEEKEYFKRFRVFAKTQGCPEHEAAVWSHERFATIAFAFLLNDVTIK